MGIIDGRVLLLTLTAVIAAQCAVQAARRSRPGRVVRVMANAAERGVWVVANAAGSVARPTLSLAPPPKPVPDAAQAAPQSSGNVSEIVFRCDTCHDLVRTTDLAVLGVWLCGKCRPVALFRRALSRVSR